MERELFDAQHGKTFFLASGLYDGLEDVCISQLLVLLENADADPNFILPGKGIAPIHFAVGMEHINFAEEATKLFLHYGADPNIRTVDGQTPVHIAAAWGRVNILYLLLLNGGDPWLEDSDAKNAFHYSYKEEHWDTIALLMRFANADKCNKHECNKPYYLTFEKMFIQKGNVVMEYEISTDSITDEYQPKSFAIQVNLDDKLHERCTKNMKTKQGQQSCFLNRCGFHCKLKAADSPLVQQSKQTFSNVSYKRQGRNCKIKHLSHPSNDLLNLQSQLMAEIKSLQIINKNCESTEKINYTCCPDELLIRTDMQISSNEHVCNDKGALNSKSIKKIDDSKYTERSMENIVALTESHTFAFQKPSHEMEGYIQKQYALPINEERKIKNEKATLYVSDTLFPSDKEETASHSCFSSLEDRNSFQMQVNRNKICACNAGEWSCNKKTCASIALTANTTALHEKLNFGGDGDEDCHNSSAYETNFSNKNSYETAQEFLTISDEYRYTDEEQNVTLLERRLLIYPVSFPDFKQNKYEKKSRGLSIQDSPDLSDKLTQSEVSVPSSLEYATDSLRKKLVEKGYVPGPITTTTKKIYLKKLVKLRKHNAHFPFTAGNNERVYSAELQKTLKNFDWESRITEYMLLEKSVVQQFAEPNSQQHWREGIIKSSFAYILLDPRITNNLPYCAPSCSRSEVWTKFLSAVFYIGKGKRSRPYSHLYKAFAHWKKNSYKSIDDKIQYILDIWKDGLGVVCLHVFQNVIPVEAYTREAAMIDAIGLRNLKNNRLSEYYGIAATWTSHQKRKWGAYLLYRALCIFLFEGERQLRPSDIAS